MDADYWVNSERDKIEDKLINKNINDQYFKHKLLIRVGAKGITFTKIDFSHTYFDNCYFRNCIFISCNFNGCKFSNCNLTGAAFPDSEFEYALFEKTIVDTDILINNSPRNENQKQKFARSLRVNYASIGDSEAVNKAMHIELLATKKHLLNKWSSREKYYRLKYKGLDRFNAFFEWLNFLIKEIIWGNGEKPSRLFRSGLYVWILMTLLDVMYFKDINLISNYITSFLTMPSIFFGINKPENYSELYLSLISMIRLIGFGLFMSIVIKKYNKR